MTLGDGLEEIGPSAFERCTALREITIPPAVKSIDDSAFKDCSYLTSVKFSNDIKQIMSSEVMSGWWNQGLHEKSLTTYCFMTRCNIPERFGLVLVESWQANIYSMLRSIPTISAECLDVYFDTIDTKLTEYENLSAAPTLFELAIPNNDIVIRVLSFILIGNDGE